MLVWLLGHSQVVRVIPKKCWSEVLRLEQVSIAGFPRTSLAELVQETVNVIVDFFPSNEMFVDETTPYFVVGDSVTQTTTCHCQVANISDIQIANNFVDDFVR